MVRSYELMLIIRSTLDQKAAAEVVENVRELIEKHKGSIVKVDVWGRRKLAYPIDNLAEGTYVLLKVMMIPSTINDIEFTLKLNEAILRYMIVKDRVTVDLDQSKLTDEETVSDEFGEDANLDEPDSEDVVSEADNSTEATETEETEVAVASEASEKVAEQN